MDKIRVSKGRKGQKGRKGRDETFKRHVAHTYTNGDQSLNQLAKKFNIPNQTISRWVKQFSVELAEPLINDCMTDQEKADFEALKKANEALQKKLEYEQLKNFALETLVDLAKEELGIDLRKNSGARQPGE
jgi:transposase-like protein